ncbi:MAG: BlaI/MecI/CopY family transcriptional regulator [Bacteroidota bacterium]
MKRNSLTPLGETEMELLHLVWELGEATVADVHARILQRRQVAYTTIMTVLKKLATKGYLDYRKDGTSYVYHPARTPGEVQHSVLQSIMQKVFLGSPSALVHTLVSRESLTPDEIQELRALIESLDEEADDNA